MSESERKSVNRNGSISGIVNLGNNCVNINGIERENTNQLEDNYIEKSKISKNDFTKTKKDHFSYNIVKIVIEVLVGVLVSVLASVILYKLNMK